MKIMIQKLFGPIVCGQKPVGILIRGISSIRTQEV